MRSALQAGRGSRGLSAVLRAWWALRQQKRRRGRAQGWGDGVPPQVVLNPAVAFWCPTDPAWVSVRLSWSYPTDPFSDGTFEIAQDLDGEGSFEPIAWPAVSDRVGTWGGVSSYEWVHVYATNTNTLLRYRVRCVDVGGEGAWSDVCEVDINSRDWAFP
ncbi:MAG TPA: hypothetical protein P5205_21435 [Candidatus Paceibacterota bacterium]|nr:hypothetical protein [Verrucomicrobiota bacterium]HSA12926.1 hypothetical protein [Candidatus Paceibacterota bacterium]